MTVRSLADDANILKPSVNTLLKDNLDLERVNPPPAKTTEFLCRIALVFRDFFVENSMHIVPQPAYSPDLAPCDFWLFPKSTRGLRKIISIRLFVS